MPVLDIRTLALADSLFFCVLALYLWHFRLTRPPLAGVCKYALASLAGGLGMALLMLRGHVPDLVSVVLANLLAGLFSQILHLGLAEFLGRRQVVWPHVLVACLLLAGLLYFTYVQPDVGMRVVLISLVVTVYCLLQAFMIWRWSAPVVGSTNWPLLVAYLGLGLVLLLRVAYSSLFEWRLQDFMQAGLAHSLSLLAFMLGGFLIMVGLVFMAVQRLELEARRARAEVHQLSGLLPICSSCKRIRDDQGYWHQVEAYVRDHSAADFTHGICPDCMRRLYPGFADNVLKSGNGD